VKAVMVRRLDRCRDQVIDGFKRYAALAMLARNLRRIGALLLAQEAEAARRARERRHRSAARPIGRLDRDADASGVPTLRFRRAPLRQKRFFVGHDSTQALRRRPGAMHAPLRMDRPRL
jgi:hypothetical protein